MIKKAVAVLSLASMMVVSTAVVASAGDVVDTNLTDKVECLFRVYIQEGGEQGLECLV